MSASSSAKARASSTFKGATADSAGRFLSLTRRSLTLTFIPTLSLRAHDSATTSTDGAPTAP